MSNLFPMVVIENMNISQLCDKKKSASISSKSSSIIKTKKKTRKRVFSSDSVISIQSSEPNYLTPIKKKIVLEQPTNKKQTSSKKKNKKFLDGTNCKKITDFYNSAKKSTVINSSVKSQVTQPVSQPVKKSKASIKARKKLESILGEDQNVPEILPRNNVPKYKLIEGTSFAVDAFKYGPIDGVTDYFLTHFHADHYIGLKKSFKGKIYMTRITANLVIKFLKVEPQFISILNLNERYSIGNSVVVAVDANQ